ncbi:hypothetical protein L2D08_10190 [Domibacillus sp. PGB-M46]|uniref:hypothetical protein n=1 Tax=Domibacillus sp. PGB-M46 TaxID=2910255 RepID=UPI001F562604|nr:hypothetical protein [Domibacillus sp. PGB-M46]MCI2254734.1 hypothetical protein [Domibacillus sp. PGB-M46]
MLLKKGRQGKAAGLPVPRAVGEPSRLRLRGLPTHCTSRSSLRPTGFPLFLKNQHRGHLYIRFYRFGDRASVSIKLCSLAHAHKRRVCGEDSYGASRPAEPGWAARRQRRAQRPPHGKRSRASAVLSALTPTACTLYTEKK